MTKTSRRVESAKRMAVRQRNYRRVRDRALTRLAQAYPETYKELLELEKVNDCTSGAKWIDIDGNTSLVVVTSTGGKQEGTIIESATDNREDKGDDQ